VAPSVAARLPWLSLRRRRCRLRDRVARGAVITGQEAAAETTTKKKKKKKKQQLLQCGHGHLLRAPQSHQQHGQ
jgi:hypothetical protein